MKDYRGLSDGELGAHLESEAVARDEELRVEELADGDWRAGLWDTSRQGTPLLPHGSMSHGALAHSRRKAMEDLAQHLDVVAEIESRRTLGNDA